MKIENIQDYTKMTEAIRSACKDLAQKSVPEDRLYDCRLIATELIANVIQHQHTAADLSVELQKDDIRITVESACRPDFDICAVLQPSAYDTTGRGLFIVKELCDNRVYRTEYGVTALLKIN